MSAPQKDLAFNVKLWAYDTGQPDRQPYRVIRVRKDPKDKDTRSASSTLAIFDPTDAGKEWSEAELDLNLELGGSLVVLVGEIVPEKVMDMDLRKPSKDVPFDPRIHSVVLKFENTIKVVRRLANDRCNLLRLLDKENGLCRMAPLPQKIEGRLVYYSEWTKGPAQPMSSKRTSIWRSNVNQFCKEYMSKHQDESNDSGQPPAPDESWITDAGYTDQRLSALLKLLNFFEVTKSTVYLDQGADILRQLLGQRRSQRLAEKPIHIENLRQLMNGTDKVDKSNVVDVIRTCKILWALWNVPESYFEPFTAHGLRQGALGKEAVKECSYRTFLATFCHSLVHHEHEPGDITPVIQLAHRIAAMSVPVIIVLLPARCKSSPIETLAKFGYALFKP